MKKRGAVVFAVFVLLSLGFEFFGHGETGHGPAHWWSGIPGFFVYFGFIGGCLLVVLAKGLGKRLLFKREDYYKDE